MIADSECVIVLRRLVFRRAWNVAAVLFAVLLVNLPVFAQTLDVSSTSDLNTAIQTINANPTTSYTIDFLSNVTLNQALPDIASQTTIQLTGNSNTLDGASTYQQLVIDSGAVTISNLNLANPGGPITINGGKLTDTTGNLTGNITNNGQVVLNETTNFTFNGNVSGTGSLQAIGGNTVTLTGNNTYTGGTLIDNGTTVITGTSNLTGAITTNYVLDFSQTTAGTYGGNISGAGGVEISSTGPVTLTGANTYGGGTMVDNGSSLIGTTSSLQGVIYNFGSVQFNQSTAGTYAGLMTGSGSLEVSGTGPITLTGLNGYAGGTTVDSGSSLIGTTDTLVGNIVNSGKVTMSAGTQGGFNINLGMNDPVGTYSGNISGTGSVEISGASPVTLSGTNSYSGGTLLDLNSTLIGTTSSLQGAITNNGSIQFLQSTNGTYAGNMSGSGSVEIGGTGQVTFSGTNSYSGGTTVDAGATLSGSSSGIQGAMTNNGAVIFSQGSNGTYAGNMTGNGSVEVSNSVSITFSGMNSYSGGTTVDANSVLMGSTTSLQGQIVNNGTVEFLQSGLQATQSSQPLWVAGSLIQTIPTYSGNMSGAGAVIVGGGGTVNFTGMNSYLGSTTINTGTTLIGSSSSLPGPIINNGSLIFNQTSIGAFGSNISGTGNVTFGGGSSLTLSGTNSYSGGSTINSGTHVIGTTTSLEGVFVDNGIMEFNQAYNGIFAGNISGTGSVLVTGTGIVTFTGNNTYSGGVSVAAGSTLVTTTSALQGTIQDNGVIQFNQTTPGTFSGMLTGTGSVQIEGYGPVTFSGVNNYQGGTEIGDHATLIVGPAGVIGNVTVDNGGTLQGEGVVGNTTVNAGGTIYPGTVGAPLTINGNFTQSTGSTFSAELSPTASDRIIVTGTATVNTGTSLNLVVDPGVYAVGTKFDILSAAGGLTGKYSTVSTSPYSQAIAFKQYYDANNLIVAVSSNVSADARTANQAAVASLIDQASGVATGSLANAITQLTTLSPSQIQGVLNQLSGDIYPSLGAIQRQTTTAQMQLLSSRLANLSGPGVPAVVMRTSPSGVRLVSRQMDETYSTGPSPSYSGSPTRSMNWSTWAQGYGLGGNISGNGNAGGVGFLLGGTMFGIDRWLSDTTMIGVFGGYAGNSVTNSQSGATAGISTYQVGLYELFRDEALYVSNIDAFNNDNYSVTRPMNFGPFAQTASASSYGNEWAHYTELGTTLDFDDFRLQPFLGVQYMYLNQHGYNETGAGNFDMSTSNQIVNSVRSNFGARMSWETYWENILILPTLTAQYQREWGNGTQLITSAYSAFPTSQFAVSGTSTGRDFGLFSMGATAFITDQFNLYGSLDAQVASGYYAIIGTAGLRYSW